MAPDAARTPGRAPITAIPRPAGASHDGRFHASSTARRCRMEPNARRFTHCGRRLSLLPNAFCSAAFILPAHVPLIEAAVSDFKSR